MKNKKTLLIALTTATLALGGLTAYMSVNVPLANAESCDHVGYHYAAHDASCSEAGNKEFWACCKCLHQWTSNPGGDFVDNTLSSPLDSTHVAYLAPEHVYNGKLVCNGGCGESFAEANGFASASSTDLITPVTLSDLGQAAFDFTNSHTFVTFDFAKNGDFEFNYSYKYTQKTAAGDSYYSIYLFNGRDEKGLVLQVNTNRTESGSDVYIYRNSVTQSGAAYKGKDKVKDLPTGRSEDGHYYFPHKAQITGGTAEDTNIMSIRGVLVDKTTNEYNVYVKTGNSASTLSQLNTDFNQGTEANEITLNIVLGANYFDSVINPCFRFSQMESVAVHASDYVKTYSTKEVVYANEDGVACGKKDFASGTPIATPKVAKTGYKFIGWCDKNGNDARDITENGKYVLTPRFIQDLGQNQIRKTLSDLTMGNKDTTKWTNSWTGETISTYGFKDATAATEVVEVAFRYRYNQDTGDKYSIFGFTYDGVNATGRVFTRIDVTNDNKLLRGYIYGGSTSLGNAGGAGTRYVENNYTMVENAIYLVRIQVVKNQSNFTINFIVESLGNGQAVTVTRDFTFNSADRIDFSDPLFTKFGIVPGSYAPMVKDAY